MFRNEYIDCEVFMAPPFRGVVRDCEICGETFRAPPNRAKTAKYCSTSCAGKGRGEAQKRRVDLTCPECGKVFSLARSQTAGRRFCSHECKNQNAEYLADLSARMLGSGNPMWKGGTPQHKDGYRYRHVGMNHPFGSSGYLLEHRFMMEQHLRKNIPGSKYLVKLGNQSYLSPDYVVHHRDENRLNNHISNLECMTTAAHISLHNDRRRQMSKESKR